MNRSEQIHDVTRARLKITVFGHFGAANFGNEATIQAMLHSIRRRIPHAEITCICTAPEIVKADYKIEAVPMSRTIIKPWASRSLLVRFLRKLLVGAPSELYRWFDGVRMLRGSAALIVVGTGLMTDAFGVFGWGPYSVFKWSLIAKLCRCKLIFLSVGAGPVETWRGRFLVKSALALANFRSYRDFATLRYLDGIGLKTSSDHVYPDLAFSLTQNVLPPDRSGSRRQLVVGVGLMAHAGMYGGEKTTSSHYATYQETLVAFIKWLLDRDYGIRLLIGDLCDMPALREFIDLLEKRSVKLDGQRFIVEPVTSTKNLLSQLGETDFVVATRFHNVLLALLLGKPSIAISFHHKCSSLMSEMGLANYCEDIRQLTLDNLIHRFRQLQDRCEALKCMISEAVEQRQKSLEEQFTLVFEEMLVEQHNRFGVTRAHAEHSCAAKHQ